MLFLEANILPSTPLHLCDDVSSSLLWRLRATSQQKYIDFLNMLDPIIGQATFMRVHILYI